MKSILQLIPCFLSSDLLTCDMLINKGNVKKKKKIKLKVTPYNISKLWSKFHTFLVPRYGLLRNMLPLLQPSICAQETKIGSQVIK